MATGDRAREDGGQRRWKVGELAKATGVSVRTLHHYDEIGLLSPSHRSRAGHRRYGPEDLLRLQQILSLRQLGLSLEEINGFLKRRGASPTRVVALHLSRVREQIQLLTRLAARLEGLAKHLEAQEQATTEDLLKTMEVMTMIEKYYTEGQLQQLEARRKALGEEEIRKVEAEWPTLIAAVRAEMEKGTDPASPEVQRLTARWMELVEQFTGGDPGIRSSLQQLYTNEPQVGAKMGLDPALFAYVNQACAAAKGAS